MERPADAKAKFGVNVEIDKSLDEIASRVLCPEKVEEANQTLSNLEYR